jgi:endogenous inhibitor of DNA gyrase (YacG/DUF329 family)
MAEQTCPKCGARFHRFQTTGDAWAKSVVSLLNPAPAVRDMVTQVRCPHCQHLFADGDVRYLAPWSRRARVLLLIACLIVFAWAVYLLLRGT